MDLEELLESSTARDRNRACFLLHVKPDMLTEYVAVHQDVWAEMRGALSRHGWRSYSLFLDSNTGLVVGYFESDDVEAAMVAMDSDEINIRWQSAMEKFFLPPHGGHPQLLQQYFHLA